MDSMDSKIFFLGAGKMATAIVGGMINSGVFKKENIFASDTSEVSADLFSRTTGVNCLQNLESAKLADVLVLAVKPQVAESAVAPLSDIASGKLVISIAAGLSIDKISNWLPGARVIRVMPNTPLMIGKGASVFASSENISEKDKAIAKAIFGASGIVFELDEKLIDAVTALSGSGPAYIFEMIDAMSEAGASLGLPADIALELAAQTALGAAEMVKQKKGTPCELRNAVTSPGGTTAAALSVMKDKCFRELINDSMAAARDRSIELGK